MSILNYRSMSPSEISPWRLAILAAARSTNTTIWSTNTASGRNTETPSSARLVLGFRFERILHHLQLAVHRRMCMERKMQIPTKTTTSNRWSLKRNQCQRKGMDRLQNGSWYVSQKSSLRHGQRKNFTMNGGMSSASIAAKKSKILVWRAIWMLTWVWNHMLVQNLDVMRRFDATIHAKFMPNEHILMDPSRVRNVGRS